MKKLIQKLLQPSNAFTGLLQLLFFPFFYLGIVSGAEWHWWAIAVFMWAIVYTVYGNNIMLHRYCCHEHFTLAKWKEYPLLWLGCMVGVGGPLSYAMTHLVHHNPKYCDTDLDPHGPARGKRSWLMSYQLTVDPAKTPIFSKQIVRLRKRFLWMHEFYTPIVIGTAVVLYLIDPYVFLFGWAIPASFSCWGIGFAVWRQHLGLKAQNAKTHKWEVTYEGLHLNHHLYPGAPDTAVNKNEIDWTYQLSRVLRPNYDWRGQPNQDV